MYSRSTPSLSSQYTDILSGKNGSEDVIAAITLLPSLPLFIIMDATVFLNGSWIEYIPNSFYIEMVPAGKKTASVDFCAGFKLKISL